MERNSAAAEQSSTQKNASQQISTTGLLLLVFLCPVPGCSIWGKSELKQYQEENKRLLSDFRAQRDRAEQLEIEKRALVGRLKDLEGRMAAISNALQDPAGPLAPSGLSPQSANAFPGAPTPSGTPALPASQPQPQSQNSFLPSSALDAWQAKEAR